MAKYKPVIFLTVQKSHDNSKIMVTKIPIKLLLNQLPNKYTATAADRKAKWHIVTYGCLKEELIWQSRR